MIEIRNYQATDKLALHHICKQTSSIDVSTPKSEEILYTLYNDYYTTIEPESVFVAVDTEKDNAVVGYILSAKDNTKYRKAYKKHFHKKLRRLSLRRAIEKRFGYLYDRICAKEYPAHLHIDILDGYRGQGVGRRLINTLKEHLIQNNVHGVSLCVGKHNKNGIAFYNKMGFKKHDCTAGVVRFVMKF